MAISDKKYRRKVLDPKFCSDRICAKSSVQALRKKQGNVALERPKSDLPGKYGDSKLHKGKGR